MDPTPRPLSLTVIVPAHDEDEALPRVLPPLVEQCRAHGWHLVVVDDGSTDRTPEILRDVDGPGLTVVRNKVRRGYGGAIKAGVRAASTDLVVTMDADGQHRVPDLERLLARLTEADADMVIGARADARSGAYRGVGRWVIRWIVRLLLPLSVRDLNSGMKLYRRDLAVRYFALCPDTMAYSDTIALVFLHFRHRVVEIPIEVEARRSGRSGVTTLTAFETVLAVLHIVMLLGPMRIFLPLAGASILSGLLWGLPFVLQGRGISVGAMLALITGLILFALGLLAEQLAQIRKGAVVEQ